MTHYKVGIIGYGWAARRHLAAINATSLARVTSIYSSRPLEQAALDAEHGPGLRAFNDLPAFLAQDDLAVVSICSLPHLHARHAVAAAEAGKHLIIERPAGMNHEECSAVRQAVFNAGVRACVCFPQRHSRLVRAIKSALDAGLLGRIHYAEVDFCENHGPPHHQSRWNAFRRDGGSSLLLAGCQALDVLLLFMGLDVKAVSSYATHSSARQFAGFEFPTTSVTLLKYHDGRLAKVTSCVDALRPPGLSIRLFGSEGCLADRQVCLGPSSSAAPLQWTDLAEHLPDLKEPADDPLKTMLEDFLRATAQNQEAPLTNLREALNTHEVLFAAERSAQRHEGKS